LFCKSTITIDTISFSNLKKLISKSGTIGVVLIGKNTVWAMPDKYDFESHNTPGSFWRNTGTIMGAMFSQFQYGFGGAPLIPFPIYFMGTQNIPDK